MKTKKTSVLIIISFLSVLGLGIYTTYTTPTLVNKCDGYGNVKFGMDINKVKEIAQKEGIVIKPPVASILVNRYLLDHFIYGTFTQSDRTANVLYFYNPNTKQVYDIMIFYPWADDEYYEVLFKEMKKKYGNILGTPSGAHWWGHKRTISLGWVIREDLGVWKGRVLRTLYRDKELYKAYQEQTEQQRKEWKRKRLSIDSDKL